MAAHRWFWRPRCLGAILVLAGIGAGVLGVWHDDIQQALVERMSGSREEVGGAAMKGASERLPVWKSAFEDILAVPTGVGPGNFNREGDLSGDYHAAHSEYIGMLAERGFVGLAGWLGVLGGILLMIGRLGKAAAAGFEPLGVPALYGLVGAIATHALVIELSHFRHTWLVFALVAGAAAQTMRLSAHGPAVAVALQEAA
jgi:O-antigen ligase